MDKMLQTIPTLSRLFIPTYPIQTKFSSHGSANAATSALSTTLANAISTVAHSIASCVGRFIVGPRLRTRYMERLIGIRAKVFGMVREDQKGR
jgi:hypothetical protein